MQLLNKGIHRHSLVKKGSGIVDWSSCPFLYRNAQFDTKIFLCENLVGRNKSVDFSEYLH
jgi:hypothetical protein